MTTNYSLGRYLIVNCQKFTSHGQSESNFKPSDNEAVQ